MPIALTEDQIALAQTVGRFADRHCARELARKNAEKFKAGERPDHWSALVSLGLHATHLPECFGGQGGSVEDAAVVIAEAGRCLIPGPLLPTVIASTVTCAAPRDDVARGVLEQFGQGATGTFINPACGVTFTSENGDYRLNGSTDLVLGAASADLLLIGARQAGSDAEGEACWFIVESSTAGIEVNVREGVDLGRDLAGLHFRDVWVHQSNRLAHLYIDEAADIAVALMAAEAAGIIRWLSETAIEFVRGRTQFGLPIGAFQAV